MKKLIEIYDQDSFGRGVGKINDKIVFVKNALKNEVVEIEIKSEKKNFTEGETSKIIKQTDERKKYECEYFSFCGGCDLGHQKYDFQIKFKKERILKSLKKIGKIENIKIDRFFTDKQFYYRNKIILRVNKNKLGFYKNKTNEIIDINKCIISNEKINEIINILKLFIKENTNNNIEKIFIRSDFETMIGIYSKNFELSDIFISCFKNYVDSIILNEKTIYKADFIYMQIENYKFKVSKNSFFQINKNITEKMYNIIKKLCFENGKLAIDLYCGVGTIGIFIHEKYKKIIGIEIENSAIKNAKENSEINKIKNIEFLEGKVENLFEKINDEIDTLILDPPRSGIDKKTISQIIMKNPKQIIYVSCNIDTMSRDLLYLKEHYDIENTYLFDMFPNTHHVETIISMRKK